MFMAALFTVILFSLDWRSKQLLTVTPSGSNNAGEAFLRRSDNALSVMDIDISDNTLPKFEYELNATSGARLFASEYADEHTTPSCGSFHDFSVKRTHPEKLRLIRIPGHRRELKILKWRVQRYTENMSIWMLTSKF